MPEEEGLNGRRLLNNWLQRSTVVHLSDGRHVKGVFLCTDRDANVILNSCTEYVEDSSQGSKFLGLVLVPGKHIKSIYIDVKDSQLPRDESGNEYYNEGKGSYEEPLNSSNDMEGPLLS